jgi:OOP family OmpA-OmpF porin
MGNFMAGVTGQIKLSDRVALTGIYNYPTQTKFNFDGAGGSSIREVLVEFF